MPLQLLSNLSQGTSRLRNAVFPPSYLLKSSVFGSRPFADRHFNVPPPTRVHILRIWSQTSAIEVRVGHATKPVSFISRSRVPAKISAVSIPQALRDLCAVDATSGLRRLVR